MTKRVTKRYGILSMDRESLPIDDPAWESVPELRIDCYPWQGPADYRPNASARLVRFRGGFAVRMWTDEQPLLARAVRMNDDVFRDSCMEFFLQPDRDQAGYFNFELNPLGTLLLGFGPDRGGRRRIAADPSIFSIRSQADGCSWTLRWEIPFGFLSAYGFDAAARDFRGNFYKCGDETIHPHYGCWNPVGLPAPDFHAPAHFGLLTAV